MNGATNLTSDDTLSWLNDTVDTMLFDNYTSPDNDTYYHDDDEDGSPLTQAQDIALSLTPLLTGLLSAYGSAQIISITLRSSHRVHEGGSDESGSQYKRIMLGLSVFDLIGSLTICWQAFLLPADTSTRIFAFGNDATCSMMGFFQQLSIASIWYSGVLSIFFYWTIRHGQSLKWEWLYHAVAIGHPLITSVVGAVLETYGHLGAGHYCWVAREYPEGCVACQDLESTEDVVCCQTPLLAYTFAAVPTFLVMIVVIINNLLIYCHLRRTIRQANHGKGAASLAASTDSAGDSASCPHLGTEQPRAQGSSEVLTNVSQVMQRDVARERMEERQTQKRQNQRLKAVAVQAFLYVGGFLLTQLPLIVQGVMATGKEYTAENDGELFPILMLRSILWPLQGLFNYLIFLRPSYLRET